MSDVQTMTARLEARVSAETEMIRLSREASRALAAALIDPAEPNEALRRAAGSHRRLIVSR